MNFMVKIQDSLHFVFAHSRIHILISLLFSAFITHGYMPNMFMQTAIVPIIKNKTGDTSDKNNYRPIALVTAVINIFSFNDFYIKLFQIPFCNL